MKFNVIFVLLAVIGTTFAGLGQFFQGAMRAASAVPQAMIQQFESMTGAGRQAATQPAGPANTAT